MGIIVIVSNYLVQFPIQYYGLQEILTYGAFSYPVTFLITDLANRAYGKVFARKIVNIGFVLGIFLTIIVSTNFSDLISVRVAIGSGVAFLVAQNIDVQIFDKLRNNKNWYLAPFVSSLFGSMIDTILFFFISFFNTGIPWVSLAAGDFIVKVLIALSMLIPFRIFFYRIKNFSGNNNLHKI
jgi:uncharacterized integral membrane protein (TIGR00697 family)